MTLLLLMMPPALTGRGGGVLTHKTLSKKAMCVLSPHAFLADGRTHRPDDACKSSLEYVITGGIAAGTVLRRKVMYVLGPHAVLAADRTHRPDNTCKPPLDCIIIGGIAAGTVLRRDRGADIPPEHPRVQVVHRGNPCTLD